MEEEIKQRVSEALQQLDRGSAGLDEAEKLLNALREAGHNTGDMSSKLSRARQMNERTRRALAKQGYV